MEQYRVRGSTDRIFTRSRSYPLDQILQIAASNQRTVHDGRGGKRVRRASRLIVRDPSAKHPDVLFVRDYSAV